MKFNLSKLYLPILAIAMFGQCNIWANPELENKVAASFDEFVDLSKHPHKKWEYYVTHWIEILNGDAKYAEFCKLLRELKSIKSPTNIGARLQSFFKRNQHLIPQSLVTKLEAHQKVLLQILAKRVGGNGR